MLMFPLWLLKLLVYGGLTLCTFGVLLLLTFLVFDSRGRKIW